MIKCKLKKMWKFYIRFICFSSAKRFNNLVCTYRINYKHPPWIFGCIDVNYFVIIKEYISMNTYK